MSVYYYITSKEFPVKGDFSNVIDLQADDIIHLRLGQNGGVTAKALTDGEEMKILMGNPNSSMKNLGQSVESYFTESSEYQFNNFGFISSMDMEDCISIVKDFNAVLLKKKKIDVATKTILSEINAMDDSGFYMVSIDEPKPDTIEARSGGLGDDDDDEEGLIPEKANKGDDKVGKGPAGDAIASDTQDPPGLKHADSASAATKRMSRDTDNPDDRSEAKKAKLSIEDFSNITETELLDMIELIGTATEYEGLSVEKIRLHMVEKYPDRLEFAKMLSIAFVAYARVGNNMGKLTIKRKDLTVTMDLITKLSQMGIVVKAQKSDSVTLPRLAIAFMPEYLAFRKSQTITLEVQTLSTINVAYQDLCFAGCDMVRKINGYDDYYSEFSGMIANEGKGIEDDEKAKKKFKEEQKKWMSVSVKGYLSDPKVASRMIEANSVNSPEEFKRFIMSSRDYYA